MCAWAISLSRKAQDQQKINLSLESFQGFVLIGKMQAHSISKQCKLISQSDSTSSKQEHTCGVEWTEW